MHTKTDILIGRDDKVNVWGRAHGRGGAAIQFTGEEATTYVHLFEGAMYELYNQLKAHIEQQGNRPTAKNVVRLEEQRLR
jgi:hypothetical protein